MSEELTVLNEYPGSHHYLETYSLDSELYCPNCASKGIWIAHSGDYYAGSDHVCVNCNCIWSMPHKGTAKEPNELKIIEQLRSRSPLEPTTRRGI